MGFDSDCKICKREVSDVGVACDICEDWYHIGCINIPKKFYKLLSQANDLRLNLLWLSDNCNERVKGTNNSYQELGQAPIQIPSKPVDEPMAVKVNKISSTESWIKPRKFSKSEPLRKPVLIELTNSFHVLDDKIEDNSKVIKQTYTVVGDSQVRGLRVNLSRDIKPDRGNSTVHCYPGATIDSQG